MARVRPGTRLGTVVGWVLCVLLLAVIAGGIALVTVGERKGSAHTVTCKVTEKGLDEDGIGYVETTQCGSMSVPSNALPWEEKPLDGLLVGRTYRFRIVETHRPLGLSTTEVVKVEGEVRR